MEVVRSVLCVKADEVGAAPAERLDREAARQRRPGADSLGFGCVRSFQRRRCKQVVRANGCERAPTSLALAMQKVEDSTFSSA